MNAKEIEAILLHELENVRAGREVWDGLEFTSLIPTKWVACLGVPSFDRSFKYRIKPRAIIVNGVEVPAPEREPLADWTRYYVPHISIIEDEFRTFQWVNDHSDKEFLARGLIYLTREDAIARAKAMLLT